MGAPGFLGKIALAYVERYDWPVFPLRGKKPATEHGFKEATCDPQQVAEWWASNPAFGIGRPTGHGVVVLDVDPRNGGNESLAALLEEHGPLPETVTSFTGGGGVHYFFSAPHGVPTRKVADGLDLKAEGGYVVLPPSRHPETNRVYEWAPGREPHTPMADLPGWLITPKNGERLSETMPPTRYRDGERNVRLISDAGSMRRRGMPPTAILAALLETNRQKCDPPITTVEVQEIVDSICRYPEGEGETRLRLLAKSDLSGVAAEDAGRVEYLVDPLLPKGEVTLIAAAWKSGKTLFSYRVALDVLLGRDALGMFHVERPGLNVGIFQLEMPLSEDHRRLRRLSLGADIPPEQVVEWSETGRLCLYNRPDLDFTARKDIKVFHQAVLGQGLSLVLVDSALAAFAGEDLNDNSEVRKVFKRAFGPLTTAGTAVVLLHHNRKINPEFPDDPKSRILGAQAWGAAAGRIYSLEPVRKPGRPTPGSFEVKLTVCGSWTPTSFDGAQFHIYDDGLGTRICPTQETALSFLESALLEALQPHPEGIPQPDLLSTVQLKVNASKSKVYRTLMQMDQRGLLRIRRGSTHSDNPNMVLPPKIESPLPSDLESDSDDPF